MLRSVVYRTRIVSPYVRGKESVAEGGMGDKKKIGMWGSQSKERRDEELFWKVGGHGVISRSDEAKFSSVY